MDWYEKKFLGENWQFPHLWSEVPTVGWTAETRWQRELVCGSRTLRGAWSLPSGFRSPSWGLRGPWPVCLPSRRTRWPWRGLPWVLRGLRSRRRWQPPPPPATGRGIAPRNAAICLKNIKGQTFSFSNSLFIYQDENEDENEKQSFRLFLYVQKQTCDEQTHNFM